MEDTELNSTLEKLHQELEQTQDLDDESVELLQHLMLDIRRVLDREEAAPAEDYQSLGDPISTAVQRFEISNPDLAAALRHALEILSGAGI